MSAVVVRGDARCLPLPDACVDLIVTSPPYFGLRSYTDGGAHYAGQIGSEGTPAEWLANLVAATAEWVRVLKPCGSMFVNLGDKYDARQGAGPNAAARGAGRNVQASRCAGNPKSLLGLPWRYALACTDQLGLILRRDIVWSKPNGLPESVTDRCRSSHEYIFHLVRQPRYYAAVDEIREPHTGTAHPQKREPVGSRSGNGVTHRTFAGQTEVFNPLGKLPGSVWHIPSQPLQVPAHLGVDHFAAFPMELPRRCILGWSPPGVCTGCGEGRRPVTQASAVDTNGWALNQRNGRAWHGDGIDPKRALGIAAADRNRTITGYACACTPYTDHPGASDPERSAAQRGTLATGRSQKPRGNDMERVGPVREYHFDRWTPPPTTPALVLDPFAGTGTTMLVASALGRHGIGVDRSADYCRLAAWRCTDTGERARAMQVPKPPPVPDGQAALFPL